MKCRVKIICTLTGIYFWFLHPSDSVIYRIDTFTTLVEIYFHTLVFDFPGPGRLGRSFLTSQGLQH